MSKNETFSRCRTSYSDKLSRIKLLRSLIAAGVTLAITAGLSGCGEAIPDVRGKTRGDAAPSGENFPVANDEILINMSADVGTESRSRSLRKAGLRENVNSEFGSLVPGLVVASVAPGQTVEQALNAIRADESVAYAEPNYLLSASVVPNDPSYPVQYGMTKIAAPQAWDLQTGTNVVVAVIDTGVDYNHPDLAANIWTNTREIAGNGVDDDGNGYIDDVRGWDFVQNDNTPMDLNDHGTHVSGVIAGIGNNAAGISGVNWRAKIMPVRFMDAIGQGSTINAIKALNYAVANGARISNSSWGGPAFSQALFDAIQAAGGKGHVFVAAAGNSTANNDTTPEYPSSYKLANIISVAATDRNDVLAAFSNFGKASVDVAAPGVGIYSTVRNGAYKNLSGTSMAAPFVTGLGTLLLAQKANLTVAEVVNAMTATGNVDVIAGLSGKVISGGRINAFKAVSSVVPVPVVNPTTPVTTTPPAITPPASTGPAVLSVSPGSVQIAVGSGQQFTASGGTAPYTWAVNNSAVGTISSTTGVFSAVALGSVNVTARDATLKASAPVTVEVAGMAIAPGNVTQLRLSSKVTFTVTGGTPPFSWTSSNPSVAAVTGSGTGSQNGVLTLSSGGSFTVTARDITGASASVGPIAALDGSQVAMSVSPAATSLTNGQSAQLNVTGGTSPFQWTSSALGVASVSQNGLVTAVGAGNATITLRDGLNKSALASVNVRAASTGGGTGGVVTPPVGGGGTGGLTTDVRNFVLGAQGTRSLAVSGGTPPYTWSSTSPSVATVTNQGTVTAGFNAGSAFINVRDAGTASASVAVEVRVVQIGALAVSVRTGASLQLSAVGGKAPFTWSVDNTVFGTINQNGLLIGGSPGSAVVRVIDADQIQGAASIGVTP